MPAPGPTARLVCGPAALWAALAAGCGGGPVLSNLRCRLQPCQSPEQPFTVRLSVEFQDATGTLGAGALELRVNGATQSTVALADLFAAQRLDPAAKSGTLAIDQDVVLDRVGQNQQFTTSLLAHDGAGGTSNEPSLGFLLTLGGP